MTRPDASLTVTGYASRDPELRFTPSGTAVANVDVPWTPRRFNRNTNQWEDAGDTLWVQVSVWGDEAEAFAENVFKGTLLTVTGRPRLSVFTGRDGTPGHPWGSPLTLGAYARRPHATTARRSRAERSTTPSGPATAPRPAVAPTTRGPPGASSRTSPRSNHTTGRPQPWGLPTNPLPKPEGRP